MAERQLINGRKYTLFIDHDRKEIIQHPEDWIGWFKQRVLFILIDPIEEILKTENKKMFDNENFTIFLGIVTLICCGIEALGGFYKGEGSNKNSSKNFRDFVINYMDEEYKKDRKKLNALHNHFRCGLAHGFCIKQGGMTWGNEYFVQYKDIGLQISINMLFKDFKQAFFCYIADLEKALDIRILNNFRKRFRYVFILGN